MTHDRAAIKDLVERMSNQKVEGNDGPGFRHVNCPKMLWEDLVRLVEGLKVEEGCSPLALDEYLANIRKLASESEDPELSDYMEQIQCLLAKERAAQHLKREQEAAPGDAELVSTWTEPPKGLEFLALGKSSAAQPPQEPWHMTSDEREMLNIILSIGEFDTLVKHIEHVVNQKARKL